jgi:uncharacterized protein (DUF58 family)
VQLYPTRSTFHVAIAGAVVVALGAAARSAPIVAFGGAMLLAVAIGRAMALVAVTRLRAAGFEMLWTMPHRVQRTARGGFVTMEAELRNRGIDEVRGVAIRPIVSSMLEADVDPKIVDLPAGARVRVDVTVRARRVGRWGVHGLALEVRGTPVGGEGLYEVPLLFANPLGVEVFPRALHAMVQSPRGGRARRASEIGRPSNVAGDGEELRELREHVPGDPFKRIAWKASARRGQLLVREMEREERDVVWLVLDASVELWAGAEGRAPLDEGVDELAALAARHLRRGDHVGLAVTASRLRTWITPASGPAHAARLAGALASAASMVDADRSELDEIEVAQRVAEHLRPLDPRGLADIAKGDLDALTRRAESLRSRAPFAPRLPFALTPREKALRHYLAAFGIEIPPRVDGEREKTEGALAQVLEKIGSEKPRASVVVVWAPPPTKVSTFAKPVGVLRAARIHVTWSVPPFEASVGHEKTGTKRGAAAVQEAVDDAVRVRAHASVLRGERVLRKLGVRMLKAVLREGFHGHTGLQPSALSAQPQPATTPSRTLAGFSLKTDG